jgi:hypothetical protein
MLNAERIFPLYLGIFEPYDNADQDAEGLALCRMCYEPANWCRASCSQSANAERLVAIDIIFVW